MSSTDGTKPDMVNHPPHYNQHPSGVEVITVTEQMLCPNLKDAVKYLCRYQHKGSPVEDLGKAAWYVRRELHRRGLIVPKWFAPTGSQPVQWRAEWEPFYLYVAAEPDVRTKMLLVGLWNADKEDRDEVYGPILRHVADSLDAMMDVEVAQQADAEERAAAQADAEEQPAREARVSAKITTTTTAARFARDESLHQGAEVLFGDKWYAVESVWREKGGEVRIARHRELSLKFGARQQIKIRHELVATSDEVAEAQS